MYKYESYNRRSVLQLENKLKEVRDKKRKRTDRSETLKEITSDANECKLLPSDVDLKLKASGIVGIGETDLQLKFGESGNTDFIISTSINSDIWILVIVSG